MFCPNCGKSDQQENSYCRQCGFFLPEIGKRKRRGFGGNTPQEQISANLFLNLLSAIVSLSLGIAMLVTFWGRGDVQPVIYLVTAFLIAMCGWQSATFFINLKLRKSFSKAHSSAPENAADSQPAQFESAQTKELLPEADFTSVVPPGVTENTTRHLNKVKRK